MGKKRYLNQEFSVQTEGRHIQDTTRKSRVASRLATSFFVFAILISISLISFTVVFVYSEVRGPSMMSYLNASFATNGGVNTDHVLVNRFRTAERGDIIIARKYRLGGQHSNSNGNFDFFIKRLIAVGGDTVHFERIPLDTNHPNIGQVWPVNQAHPLRPTNGMLPQYRFEIHLNGVPLQEYYLDDHWGQNIPYHRLWNYINVSRTAGTWQARFIQPVRYYYPDGRLRLERNEIVIPQGYIFYMGDNRGGNGTFDEVRRFMSYDSTSFGPQPSANIVGVVVDVGRDNTPLPQYIWNWIVHFITFRWI